MKATKKTKQHRFILCVIIFQLLLISSAFAQKTVTGKVISDDYPQGHPGVNVLVMGSKIGAMTDFDGVYSIKVQSERAVLSFSYVGYITQEVPVSNKSEINVKLTTDVSALDEVVVVGYGTQSKRNVTGAISKVDMKDTQNSPNSNVAQALRGRIAGIQITDNGRPGQNGSILIRGPRSLSAGNNPLIVLDGIIFNGSLSDISPNDIKSMEVLKDASSSAIYGSRAANGVILITSKRGLSNKPSISFNTFYGVSDFSYKVNLLDANRYIEEKLDVLRESGQVADINNIQDFLAPNEAENYLAGRSIDPWEEASQNSYIASYDLNVSGKTDKTNYFFSGSMVDEKGLLLNDQQKRLTLRSNFETNITDWLKFGSNITYIKRDNSGEVAGLEQIIRSSPFATWYNEDGTPREFVVDGENVAGNPIRNAYLIKDQDISNNLFANFFAVIEAPFVKGLSFRINYAPNMRWRNNYRFRKQDVNLPNNITFASKFNRNDFDWVLENILRYEKQLNKDHFVEATLLYGRNQQQYENTYANSSQLSLDALGWNDLSLGAIQTNTSKGEKVDGLSYMARLNYNYKKRYMLTATIRSDGSSVFSSRNKYAVFPSMAFGWVASDEKFMENINFIDYLKFRVSYGSVGNQAIAPYQSLSLLGTTQYVFGDGGSTSLGSFPANMANSNLKWETTRTANIGLDFRFLNGRIGGSIELYDMKTTDLIVRRSLPVMTGFSSVLTNIGEINNRGIELTLNTLNIKTEKFEWATDITFSRNKNKIVHLYNSDTDGDGREDDDLGNKWFIGQPIDVEYDYVFDGIYQEGDVLPSGFKPGYVRLKDLNGDGEITSEDRTIIGQSGQPKVRLGFSNSFKYGDFTLSVFANAMLGWTSDFGLIGRAPADRSLNFIDAGWWTPENKSNTRPSLLHENKYGHNYYVSRDFLRIQDVSLSYNLPENLLEKLKINSLRLFVSAKNLKTYTDWIGSDPESGGKSFTDLYPMPKTISVGLNFGF